MQGSNPGLRHCRQILHHLPPGTPLVPSVTLPKNHEMSYPVDSSSRPLGYNSVCLNPYLLIMLQIQFVLGAISL